MHSHGTEGIEAAGALDAARVLALALVTNFARLAVPIGGAGTCDRWLDTDEVLADALADTVTIDKALLLLASNLLIACISKESLRTGADRAMASGSAPGISATYDRTSTDIFTLKESVLTANTGVCVSALLVIRAPGLQDTNPTGLAGVQGWTLAVVCALADTTSAVT